MTKHRANRSFILLKRKVPGPLYTKRAPPGPLYTKAKPIGPFYVRNLPRRLRA